MDRGDDARRFFSLEAWVGRAAAWAFVVAMALPAVGISDLATMAWGNHQETALIGLLALFLLARGHGLATGLVLGLAVWFCRTAAYEAVVLVPAALWFLPGQRIRVLAGFGVGCAAMLVPTARGDAGYYRMEATGGSFDLAASLERAATLFYPARLADRLYLPVRGQSVSAALTLAAAAVAAGCAALAPRGRIILALGASYAMFYSATQFPLFLAKAGAPVNNIRYHAPWAFVLALLTAAGAGWAWDRRHRALAIALVGVPLLANVPAWIAVAEWPQDPSIFDIRATDGARFALVAGPRLPLALLASVAPANDHAVAMFRRIYGLRLGEEAREGRRSRADTLAEVRAVRLVEPALEGFGQATVERCTAPSTLNVWLDTLPPAEARAIGRGAAITLAFCPAGGDVPARVAMLSAGAVGPCWLCAAAGATALRGCERRAERDPASLGACLAAEVAAVPAAEAAEVWFGAGLRFGQAMRPRGEIERVAAAIGAAADGDNADRFRQGSRHPMAGLDAPHAAARPGPAR